MRECLKWAKSAVLCNRRLPVNFRYALLATEIARRCNMSRRGPDCVKTHKLEARREWYSWVRLRNWMALRCERLQRSWTNNFFYRNRESSPFHTAWAIGGQLSILLAGTGTGCLSPFGETSFFGLRCWRTVQRAAVRLIDSSGPGLLRE